ncbi:MAG: PEP-CTERM sorting domain-containing protein [Crocosphaera sp.]
MSKYLFAKVGFTFLTMFGLGNINITSASALTITYNAGLDFSPTENPNGVWSYGNSNSLSNISAFTLYNVITEGDVTRWGDGGVTAVYGNVTDENVITFFQGQVNVVYEPDEIYLHPSTANNQGYAVVRWTSPYSSDYSINTLFQTKDQVAFSTPSVDVFVYFNGSQLYGDSLLGILDSGSFNTDLLLEEGDILDFIVGSLNDPFDDTTGLELSITTTLSVPEPSIIIGLGVLATFGLGKGFKRKLNKATNK